MGEAQRLAILLLSIENEKLILDVLRMQPHQGVIPLAEKLRVFWQSEPLNKEFYWRVTDTNPAGDVVTLAWVRKNDLYEQPEAFRSMHQSVRGLVHWAEYVDAILAFLPNQYTATSLDPAPMAAIVQGRVALWWPPPPAKPYDNQRRVQWRLTPFNGDVEAEVEAINAGSGADDLPFPEIGLN
ncbi:MAG: hypothetical protein QOH92_574 [Chloroflexota bacterium]|jgi:hypothetical protein|nr:hypothetical protein [Chloroflexota bacterium]